MDKDLEDMFFESIIERIAELTNENRKLKEEVQILTEVLRELQWRMDGLNK